VLGEQDPANAGDGDTGDTGDAGDPNTDGGTGSEPRSRRGGRNDGAVQ